MMAGEDEDEEDGPDTEDWIEDGPDMEDWEEDELDRKKKKKGNLGPFGRNGEFSTLKEVRKHCALELKGNIAGLIPPEMTLEVTISYEDNFLAVYGGDHEKAREMLEVVLTHAQSVLYDESLQTRITLKVCKFDLVLISFNYTITM